MASESQILAEDKARKLIAICRGGFKNEHHWQKWMKKHEAEIDALPTPLRDAVRAAHENATAKEFSR